MLERSEDLTIVVTFAALVSVITSAALVYVAYIYDVNLNNNSNNIQIILSVNGQYYVDVMSSGRIVCR